MQEAEFAQHCQYHLDRPETIPTQYGYLEIRGMIASPGYCPQRLGDASKSATERLKAFLDPQSLKRDMDKYYEVLEDDKPMECGSLHCDVLFSSVLELQYHYQDVHCILVPRKRSNVKPEEKSGVAGSPQDGDNTSSGLEFHITTSGSFKRFKRKRTESSDSENIDLPAKRHNYGSACGGPSNKLFSPNQTSSDGSRDQTREDSSSGSFDNGDNKNNGLDATDTSGLASVSLSHIDPRLFESD